MMDAVRWTLLVALHVFVLLNMGAALPAADSSEKFNRVQRNGGVRSDSREGRIIVTALGPGRLRSLAEAPLPSPYNAPSAQPAAPGTTVNVPPALMVPSPRPPPGPPRPPSPPKLSPPPNVPATGLDPATGCPWVPRGYTFLQGLDIEYDDFNCVRNADLTTWSVASQATVCAYTPWCKSFNIDRDGSCIKTVNGPLHRRWPAWMPCYGIFMKRGLTSSPWPLMPPSLPPLPPSMDANGCTVVWWHTLRQGLQIQTADFYGGPSAGALFGAALSCEWAERPLCWGFDSRNLLPAFNWVLAPDPTAGPCDGVYVYTAREEARNAPALPPPQQPSPPPLQPGAPAASLPPPEQQPVQLPSAAPNPYGGTNGPASPPLMPAIASDNEGLSPAAIGGIVGGAVVALLIFVAAAVVAVSLQRARRQHLYANVGKPAPVDGHGGGGGGSSERSSSTIVLHLSDASPTTSSLGGVASGVTLSGITTLSASSNEEQHQPTTGLLQFMNSAFSSTGGKPSSAVPAGRSRSSHSSMIDSSDRRSSRGSERSRMWGARGTHDSSSSDMRKKATSPLRSSEDDARDDANCKELAVKGPGVITAQMLAASSRLQDEQLEVFEVLGKGGGGTVYRALWKGVPVAAKMMVVQSHMHERARRQMLEATMSTGFSHPNIVVTYMFDLKPMADPTLAERGTPASWRNASLMAQTWQLVILQELCSGGTLGHLIKGETLSLRDCRQDAVPSRMAHVLQLAHDLACGLEHLHAKNIMHSDLTPNNVLLQAAGNTSRPAGLSWIAKVADFGLSVVFEDGRSHVSRAVVGTPNYIAPETQAHGLRSKQSDIFMLGILLYEMVSGSPGIVEAAMTVVLTDCASNLTPPPFDTPSSVDAAVHLTDMVSASACVLKAATTVCLDVDVSTDGPAATAAIEPAESAAIASCSMAEPWASGLTAQPTASQTMAESSASANTAIIGMSAVSAVNRSEPFTTQPLRPLLDDSGHLTYVSKAPSSAKPPPLSDLHGSSSHPMKTSSQSAISSGLVLQPLQVLQPLMTPQHHQAAVSVNVSSSMSSAATLSCVSYTTSSLSTPPRSYHEPATTLSAGISSSQPLIGGSRGFGAAHVLAPLPAACPPAYAALVRACLSQAPHARPTVGQVRRRLADLMEAHTNRLAD